MATAVPSRFACLKIEGDDYRPRVTNVNKDANKKKNASKAPAGKSGDHKKQKVAAGNKNGQTKSNQQNKKKKVETNAEQWEEWIQRDSELVDEGYRNELHQALILSKLDFEVNKSKKPNKITSDTDKKPDLGDGKKNKIKNKAMSLDQFNNLASGQTNVAPINGNSPELIAPDKEFFRRIEFEANREISKEELRGKVLARNPPTTEIITSSQYREQLNTKDEEIENLRRMLELLQAELLTVKTRNKKLCGIIGQGEMREKAEVLVEVDRLTKAQIEMTAELQSLHVQLEQEKSKNRGLTEREHKGKDKQNRDVKEIFEILNKMAERQKQDANLQTEARANIETRLQAFETQLAVVEGNALQHHGWKHSHRHKGRSRSSAHHLQRY